MSRYYSAKADENQPEIVDEFRRLGACVKHVHRLKNFCDLMVLYKGVVVAVEVKMPGKLKLTDGEDKFAKEWFEHGGKYAVITTKEEAEALINQIAEYA